MFRKHSVPRTMNIGSNFFAV